MIIEVAGKATYADTAELPFDPALPTIVLVHGALNDHSVWAAQARCCAQHGYNVLAPDLPGHGRSAGPALPSIEQLADWLLALLQQAGIERALLVGHSMGALIALQAASAAPERVVALALLGATYPMAVSTTLLSSARDDEAGAIEMVLRWSHSPQASAAPTGGALIDKARALMQGLAAHNPAQLLYTDLNACNNYAQGAVAAAALRCPVLMICGNQDQMTPPRSTRQLQAALAHAQIVQLDAGHALMSEQADAVSAALMQFAAAQAPA